MRGGVGSTSTTTKTAPWGVATAVGVAPGAPPGGLTGGFPGIPLLLSL